MNLFNERILTLSKEKVTSCFIPVFPGNYASVHFKYKDIESFSDKAVIMADTKGGLKKIDLIGNARVKQENNTSEGHHFIYNPITEEMSVSGNTKTIAITEDGKTHYCK